MPLVKPDGLVHALKEVTTERGTRTVTVRCGKELPKQRAQDPLHGASGWDTQITCPDCK